MNANVGNVDRVLRIVVGLALIIAALMHVIGAWGWIGVVLVGTGMLRFCPAYRLFGASTCAKQSPGG